jgi:putative tricarboxylic transport membrane protein
MENSRRARNADLVFALATIGIGTLFFLEARKLPASRFDPLGPASFPMAISALLVVMGIVALAMILTGKRVGAADTSLIVGVNQADSTATPRPLLAVFSFLAVAAYALALQLLPDTYLWSTAALVTVLGIAMSPRNPRSIGVALAIGLGGAAFLDYVFGTLLRLPMP